MRKTDFAGLTVIETNQGDSIYSDGGSFLELNPQITDKLLRVGALTHRHDGHAPLAAPIVAPALATALTGGSLPGGTRLYVAYTAIDVDGGETTLSPGADVTTAPPLASPGAPTAVAEYTAGTLRPGSYRYAISATDARGGETLIGASAEVMLAYGQPLASVKLSGLGALVTAVGGTGWRLYRSIDNGPWAYIIYGTADAITDDNSLCADCSALPPGVNSTNRTGAVTVTVPALPAGSTRYRIYASTAPAFASPSVVGDYPAADLTPKTIVDTAFTVGAPPAVSTSVGGADPIDPETDLENFHWRTPVPTAGALPAGELGDVRLTLDTFELWAHDGSTWFGPINANPDVSDNATTVGDIDGLTFEGGTGIGLTVTEQSPGQAKVTIVNTAAAGGASAGVRTDRAFTTAALAANASADGTVPGTGRTFALLRLTTSVPARVRLYTTPAKRDADATRPSTQNPTGNHGLILEVITTPGDLSWDLSPMVIGADLQAIPDGTIAARVENRGGAGTVTVTATLVPIET